MTTQQTFSLKAHAFCGSGISSCFSLNRIALHQVHNSYDYKSLPSVDGFYNEIRMKKHSDHA